MRRVFAEGSIVHRQGHEAVFVNSRCLAQAKRAPNRSVSDGRHEHKGTAALVHD